MRRSFPLLSCVIGSVLLLACRQSAKDSAAGASGGTTSASSGATTVSGASTSGTGGQMCAGDEHTVQDVTSGMVGTGTPVTLKGVVAMSNKFLVSGSTACLWGVFVSAPGITETAENTGLLILSYGTPPMVPAGGSKAFCPEQGQSPDLVDGDQIPNDVKAGDVLDVIGTPAQFPATFTTCVAPSNPVNSIPMWAVLERLQSHADGNDHAAHRARPQRQRPDAHLRRQLRRRERLPREMGRRESPRRERGRPTRHDDLRRDDDHAPPHRLPERRHAAVRGARLRQRRRRPRRHLRRQDLLPRLPEGPVPRRPGLREREQRPSPTSKASTTSTSAPGPSSRTTAAPTSARLPTTARARCRRSPRAKV